MGPRDLQVSELAHSSLRLTWSPATSDVTGYRLFVTPLNSKGHLLYFQRRQVGDAPRRFDDTTGGGGGDESSSTSSSNHISISCSEPLKRCSTRCFSRQIDLKADVSTAVVTELNPTTDYSLTVHAIYPSRVGDSATVTVQTGERTSSLKTRQF